MDSNSKNNVPNTVYHYTSPSGLLGIVDNEENSKNAKLWFTRWDSLNDKNERYDIQEVLKEYKELKGDSIPKEFQDAIQKLIDTDVDEWELPPILWHYYDMSHLKCMNFSDPNPDNIYICSFSTDGDSLPMWNYYSKSSHYEGYALGIDVAKWEERVKELNGCALDIRRVIYDEKDKIKKIDEIVSECEKDLKNESIQKIRSTILGTEYIEQNLSLRIARLQLIFKDKHFSHENEVRAILKIPKDKDISNELPTKYRTGNGYIIPYVEVSVPKEAITSVTVGPLLEKELAKKNVKEMLESRGCSCDVYTSEIPIRF